MTQVIIEQSKYQNVINILKEQVSKFQFGKDEYSDNGNQRCTLGLILSHFGWDGNGCCTKNFQQADEKLEEIVSINDQWYIAAINDESQSYDEVVERLGRDG